MRQFFKLSFAAATLIVFLEPGTGLSAPAKKMASAVDPAAMAALDKMSSYLRTLNSFEVKASTLTDEVADNGQTVQFAGTADYKVRRPDGFLITVANDRKVRQFNYDGKSFTVFAPRMDFYATVAAPPTIHALLQSAYDKFGIELPLGDLFRWGEAADRRDDISSGVSIGYAKINGMDAQQYAFQEGDIDWQIWIAQGDKPLPLKIVLTDTSDRARPSYAAQLTWTPNVKFTDATFAFKAPADAKPITIAQR